MFSHSFTYTIDYSPARYNLGVVSGQEFNDLKKESEWWLLNGDRLFKHIVKLQEDLRSMTELKGSERRELVALKMFYLSTKLAAQIKTSDPDKFEKAVSRILQAEERINEIFEL